MKLLPDNLLQALFAGLWIIIGIITLAAIAYRFFYPQQ